MGAIKNQNITYQGVDDLPIWNYTKISEGDYRWLIVGFSGYGNVDVPGNAQILFKRIQKEYYKLTKSNKSTDYLELLEDVSALEVRFTCANVALSSLCLVQNEDIRKELIEELRHLNFLFNDSKPFKDEHKRLTRQLRALRGKIQRKSKQLEAFNADEDDKVSLFAQKVNLERILGIKIDLKATPLAEWEEIKKQAQKVVKQQQKAANK